MQVRAIWIGSEWGTPSELNPADGNTEVFVTLDDGSIWTATFFSYRNIATRVESDKSSGECLGGKYFWAWDMILVDEVTRERIEEVVRHFFEERSFTGAFRECIEQDGVIYPRYNNPSEAFESSKDIQLRPDYSPRS